MFLNSLTEERLAAIRGAALWPPHCVRMRPSWVLSPGLSVSETESSGESISQLALGSALGSALGALGSTIGISQVAGSKRIL
jgi:hypothetical protein